MRSLLSIPVSLLSAELEHVLASTTLYLGLGSKGIMDSLLLYISSESYSTKGFCCHFCFFCCCYFVAVVVVYRFLSFLQKCVNFPNKPVLNAHQSLDILGAVRAKTWAFASHAPEL